MRTWSLFTLIAVAMGWTVASPTRFRRGVLCGNDLSDALAFVCGNIYFNPDRNERAIPGFTDSRIAFAFLQRNRRQATGIVDECCRKSCSYQELVAYCGTP